MQWIVCCICFCFFFPCSGGLVVWGFWGPDAYLGSSSVDPLSRFTQTSAMGLECVLTFMLLFTILSVAQQGSIIGVNGSLAVGSVIAVCVGLGAEITGGSMNPFRSLGPAIINGPIKDVWPMVAGPIIGKAQKKRKKKQRTNTHVRSRAPSVNADIVFYFVCALFRHCLFFPPLFSCLRRAPCCRCDLCVVQ